MKRIFIGIRIEMKEKFQLLFSSMKSDLRNELIKWTDPGNTHITLAFLGDTEENIISKLKVNLKEKCEGFGSFDIVLRGTGVFRNMKDPRIIWTGIDESERLNRLYTIVKSCVAGSGKDVEDKPFSPHLTIGRVKKLNDRNLLSELIEKHRDELIQKVQVGEIILFESILKPAGPEYRPLAVYRL